MGVPQNGWLTMEHPIKMDDLRVHPFMETTRSPGSNLYLEKNVLHQSPGTQNLITNFAVMDGRSHLREPGKGAWNIISSIGSGIWGVSRFPLDN